MKTLSFIAVVLLAATAAKAGETLVFSGKPTVKVESSPENAHRLDLSPVQSDEFAVVIVNRDGRYFWVSREGRELIHSGRGLYHYFIDPLGGGYVKVEADDSSGGYRYYEHINLGLATITYWGISSSFAP